MGQVSRVASALVKLALLLTVYLALPAFVHAQERQPRTGSGESPGSASARPRGLPTDELAVFVSRALATTEDVWRDKFREAGKRYEEPKLVLFTSLTSTACGMAATGPFYCPQDRKIYLDLSFFEDLKRLYRAPGNFAQAYVVAHEVGHHVQTLLGIEKRVSDAQSKMSDEDANRLNVRLELQADCLAGIWASSLPKLPGHWNLTT